jgi:putative thioredoxin
MAEAAERAQEGDVAGAAELYAAVLAEDAENVTAVAALAKLHVDLKDFEGARRFLDMVPAAKASHPDVMGARAALELAEQAASLGDLGDLERRIAADPDDHQARYDLALGLNARNRRDGAADHLLAIVKRDRTWNEDAARKQLVQLFEAWGPTDPATVAGRRRLSSILFA